MKPEDVITIGFDPSLNGLGWAVMKGRDVIECGTVKHKAKTTRNEKHTAIVSKVMMLVNHWKPNVVGIEEERVFKSVTAVIIGEIIGIIKGCSILWDIGNVYSGNLPFLIVDVHPIKARWQIGVNSNDKAQILAMMQMMFPKIEIEDHNAADAIVTANFAYLSHQKLV